MSTTTEPKGIERYAERTPEQAERLALLQDHRATLREVDVALTSPTLEAVELVDAAASALESAGAGWSLAAVERLRMVKSLLLEQDCRRVEEYARWFSVADLPFMQIGTDARRVGDRCSAAWRVSWSHTARRCSTPPPTCCTPPPPLPSHERHDRRSRPR